MIARAPVIPAWRSVISSLIVSVGASTMLLIGLLTGSTTFAASGKKASADR